MSTTPQASFEKFSFEEEFIGGSLTPKQEREQAYQAGVEAGEQAAMQKYQQQLQAEVGQRDQRLSEACVALATARIDFEAGLQEQLLELVKQLLEQLAGELAEKVPDKVLQEHLPKLLAQASEEVGGTLFVHAEQQPIVEKALPKKSGYQVQPAPQLQPGQVEIQWKSGLAVLDLPSLVNDMVQALDTGKALAKQTKHSKVSKSDEKS